MPHNSAKKSRNYRYCGYEKAVDRGGGGGVDTAGVGT